MRPIEGITLLGGEPFEQAEALGDLAERVRALGFGVMTFSGYTIEELRAGTLTGASRLLDATDLLVDGRYDAARADTTRRWAGSTNQRFHFLSMRYAPGIELASPSEPSESQRAIEISIAPDGVISVNGWPDVVVPARWIQAKVDPR